MNYNNINNNPNPVPLQQANIPAPPLRRYERRRGGVLGGNNYYNNRGNYYNNNGGNYNNNNNNNGYFYPNNQNYQNYQGYPNYQGNRRNFIPRNTYYNRNYNQNYMPPPPPIMQRRFNRSQQQQQQQRRQSRSSRSQNRSRNGSNQQQRQRSQSRQPPQRRNRPRQLRLNDFMPTEFRDPSPTTTSNLPSEFNLGATTTTEAAAITTAPPDALPQRERFAATTTTAFDTNNYTQPFIVNRQQQSTTSSHRRQIRRGKQQQQRYRPTSNKNNNRFALLSDNNDNDNNIVDNDNDNNIVEIDAPITANPYNNKKDKMKKKKTHLYLEPTRMLRWFEDNSKSSKNSISGRGNQAYLLATAPIYDEWIRNNYELQVWQTYSKIATENKHWAKEVIQRTKRRDDTTNSRFVQKKINQLMTSIAQASASISDLQIQLATYWEYNAAEITAQKQAQTTAELTTNLIIERTGLTTTTTRVRSPILAPNTMATTASTITKGQHRDPVERLEKHILEYIHHCTLHVKKMAENRIQLAKAQMAEFKALEDFEQIATPSQWNIHLMLKPKVKLCSTKNKNKIIATKRVEYDLPPKFINKMEFTFKIDESILNKDEIQATYNEMRQITKDFRTQAMKLYVQSLGREHELLSNEIKRIIEGFPSENDDGFDAEAGCAAFKQYHELPSRGRRKQSRTCRRPDSYSITGRGFLAPAIINQANIKLTEQEHQLLRLGPRFIFDDPKTAARRRTTELATLKRKLEARFFEKKVRPGRPVEQFIAELDVLLQNLHNIPTTNKKRIQFNRARTNKSFDNLSSIIQPSQSSQSQTIIRPKIKTNYGRTIKRLKYKIHLANTVLRKTDKSKVFHLGKVDHYQKKSEEYMEKTKAYQCLGIIDPLPDLIQRTNKYLLDLRLAKWITQKQYEQLSIKPNEVELAHLYYLPKAHKPGTPLRPIISGLKHPTIKISKYLDDLLRPIFDQMALNSTVTSGFELVKKLQEWSTVNMCQDTTFCTIDVTDLYTMVPQIEGVLSLRKMLDHLKLKEVGKLKVETIIRLSRFVMTNNYFSYNGQFYHQVRGGAMGSPLTLTISNCYMYFFERQIVNQIRNSGGLYFRYIDDIFITINWPARHLLKQIERWNKFDENINLSANIGSAVNFLDLNMENKNGQLITMVYQKPSYEPYYLPFNSIHPLHMKKNIPFAMLLRAFRYCSTFETYLNEREKLRMALLLNKYPNKIIDEQFNNMLLKFSVNEPLTSNNYNRYRQNIINSPIKEKLVVNYEKSIFVHFTYCSNMRTFPKKFHILWEKYFGMSPINEVIPVLGSRNVDNLQRRLVHTRSINL
ncbi:unnamed protein product [Rotaria socialis]|uniref:Reverse transcriptase domain-containing protein n=2 Tax=Rotaria socialis TaxID=392032 RepID=A0A821BZI3_9BILA|nr:unnamed protein product [Rotaria socialis]CAF3539782.1 unnamed protein product [Rotaria socialis]CAF4594898.1 unnamed protein product [Rotaria socialis]